MSKYKEKYKIYPGNSIEAILDLIEENRKFGDFLDLGLGRMGKYHLNKSDKEFLSDWEFSLPGTIALSLNKKSEVVLCNLKVGEYAEELVRSINSTTKLNKTKSFDIRRFDYATIKKAPESYIIEKSVANDLRQNAFSHEEKRKDILYYLFQGNRSIADEYIQMVKDYHKVSNITTILGFNLGHFRGMRFPAVTPLKNLGSSIYFPQSSVNRNFLGINKGKNLEKQVK